MDYNNINYRDKKSKWTIMKYVASYDLLITYAEIIKNLKFLVDDKTIDEINKEFVKTGVYKPIKKPSNFTTSFKIIQLCHNMFAYRSESVDEHKKMLVFTPLCNLLLQNKDDETKRGKIASTMLINLPFDNPYNKMDGSFNIFPYRLIFKLLLEKRIDCKLYLDEVFYLVAWTKEINKSSYNQLIKKILELRNTKYEDKYNLFTSSLCIEDSLANMLHETDYMFSQLCGAGIVDIYKGVKVGTLNHGGFGRNPIPDRLPQTLRQTYKPTGRRAYRKTFITLRDYMPEYLSKLLELCPYDEKPHDILANYCQRDYILKLYNFYPDILLDEIGIETELLNRIKSINELNGKIKKFARNQDRGDDHRFENILTDTFNEFVDVFATLIANSGTTDIDCIFTKTNEKFDIDAKSTKNKLSSVNARRLEAHRIKVSSNYTIVITPQYTHGVLTDIENSDNVVLTVPALCNFLYNTILNGRELSYEPIDNIILEEKGIDISNKLTEYVATTFGFA